MYSSFFLIILSAIVIYWSCKLFVNGIEWVGHKFNVADQAVGTVLAAFGTGLPESIVTFTAVVFSTSTTQKDIGVGAALGGPLVLSTIAYAIVGFCIVAYYSKQKAASIVQIDGAKLGRDQLWFLIIFAGNFLLGYLIFPGKSLLGIVSLAIYVLYCYREMGASAAENSNDLEPLRFRHKRPNPEIGWVLFQTVLALALIFAASQVFVSHLEAISASLGANPHIIALLFSPIATELPEILNAVIWVRQGKVALALGNISGSMMVQATIPSALGIIFTPWLFDRYLAAAAIATMASILFLWLTLKSDRISPRRLCVAALFYLLFAAGAFLFH